MSKEDVNDWFNFLVCVAVGFLISYILWTWASPPYEYFHPKTSIHLEELIGVEDEQIPHHIPNTRIQLE